MHRDPEVCDKLQAKALQMNAQRLGFRRAVTALTATAQVPPESHQQVTIEAMEHAVRMAMAKVRAPAPQGRVQPADQHR